MPIYLIPEEKTVLFIDGTSIYNTSRNLGIDIDYRLFLEYFHEATYIVRAYYYSTIIEGEDYTPVKPLTDWLSYNGFCTVIKAAKEFTDNSGKRRVKGNIDIEIAIDMMELAPKINHVVLFTGNADFRRAVEAVQRQGVRVTVVSSLKCNPPTIADELRRQCDQFVELADIAEFFVRHPSERADDRSGVDRIIRGN
jgi:uncharacterized LabA/DUF88 family protein